MTDVTGDRARRKPAARPAAVLQLHGAVAQGARGRGRGLPRARVRGAQGGDRVHRSAVFRTVLALPDAAGVARHAQRAAGPEAR